MRVFWRLLKWSGIAVLALVSLSVLWVAGHYLWALRTTVDCPFLAWIKPIRHTPIQAADSLELDYQSARGAIGTIRVYGDGRVERDTTVSSDNGVTFGCPLHEADKHDRIPSDRAKALIASARDGGFCRLCERYRFRGRISDGGRETITLNVAGASHTVDDYMGDPPAIYEQLSHALREAAGKFPDYSNVRTRSRTDEDECFRFEREQELVNAKIQHRKPDVF